MNAFINMHNGRLSAALIVCLLLASCISVPTGTTHAYRKADASRQVSLPAESASKAMVFDRTLFKNMVDSTLTVKKSGIDKTGADVFAIYLSDGYFKYLKDLSGVNEVVIVAEFTETNAGTESDKVTRVLGPYFGVADKAGAPFLNKLLYGPKHLDADHLNMKLTVLEYDQGENDNTATFLQFIQSVTQTLSLANPLTATEQAFAKEVAKGLLSLNKDDVVMSIDINFTGNAGELEGMTSNGSYIPLNVGDYVLINKEHCVMANCYFQLTRQDGRWNPFAWAGDIALLIPTGIRRAWTDTPDGAALDDVQSQQLRYVDHALSKRLKDPGEGIEDAEKYEPFIDKTWLALSIVKGGDPSLWQKRKLLTQAEAAIHGMIKVQGGPQAFEQNLQTAKQALASAREAEMQSSSGLVFIAPLAASGDFAPTIRHGEYCLYHPRTLTDVVASFYRIDANNVPQQLSAAHIFKNTRTTPNNTCFTVMAPARTVGTYDMIAAYKSGREVLTQKIRYKVTK